MKSWFEKKWFEMAAAVVLFIGMGHHPYSYYQFLHWVASVSAFYAAYRSYHAKHPVWSLIFGIVAVVFNPIVPFYFREGTWSHLDLIAGIIFVAGVFFEALPINNE